MDFDPDYMPVNTHDFALFFADEDVRRQALKIIQLMKSLNNCDGVLSLEEYTDWRDRIMDMVDEFSDTYDTHGLPEMELLACQDENSNGNPLNQGFIANNNNNNNNNIPIENIGSRFLPMDAENTITGNAVEDGNLMVNFQNEFQHGRYYKRSTYNSLNPKRNPYNPGAPITALKQYTAVIGPPIEGGKRTRRRRGLKKRTRRRST